MGDFDDYDDFSERKRDFKIDGLEILRTESEKIKDYEELDALNWSKLKVFLDDPRYFSRRTQKRSSAMTCGTILHKRFLQREEFLRTCKDFNEPINPKTQKPFLSNSKAYQDELTSLLERGFTPIGEEMKRKISNIEESLSDYGLMKYLSGDILTELPLSTTIEDFPVKGRIDCVSKEYGIVDLKTTELPLYQNGYSMSRSYSSRFGYDIQLSFYAMIIESLTGYLFPCTILYVETNEPYRCATCSISGERVQSAIENIRNDYIPLWKRYISGERITNNYDTII